MQKPNSVQQRQALVATIASLMSQSIYRLAYVTSSLSSRLGRVYPHSITATLHGSAVTERHCSAPAFREIHACTSSSSNPTYRC